MRKAVLIIAFLLIINCSVFASPGDIAGTFYSTDIKTTLNGTEISAINIGGQTLISAEDMRFFGFGVWWDESERTLRIDESAKENLSEYRADFKSAFPSGTPLGNYFETDIVTYLEKSEITSFNIGGRTYIHAEEMRDFGFDVNWYEGKRELEIISPKTGGYVYGIALSYGKTQTAEGSGSFAVKYKDGKSYGMGDAEYLNLTVHASGRDYVFSAAFYQNAGLFYSTALQDSLKPLCHDGFGVLNPCHKSEKYDEVKNTVSVSVNGVKAEKISVISGAGNGHRDFYFTVEDIRKFAKNEIDEIIFTVGNPSGEWFEIELPED